MMKRLGLEAILVLKKKKNQILVFLHKIFKHPGREPEGEKWARLQEA